MSFWQVEASKPSIEPDILFNIWHFPVSNTILMSWLITLLLILLCFYTARKLKLRPNNSQNIIEVMYEAIEGLINQLTGNKKYTIILLPLIASLFIYIGMSNLLGLLIPFLTSFTYNGVSIFRTATADFNTPFALAFSLIIYIQYISIKKWGLFKHLGKYFQFSQMIKSFKQGFGNGMMGFINFLIGLLDIISELARIISLSMRLFGNMFAGEMLAIIIIGFMAYGLPAIWMTMGLLSGVIQAMVFGSLTTSYYILAIQGEEE